jgi:hypothetical protein
MTTSTTPPLVQSHITHTHSGQQTFLTSRLETMVHCLRIHERAKEPRWCVGGRRSTCSVAAWSTTELDWSKLPCVVSDLLFCRWVRGKVADSSCERCVLSGSTRSVPCTKPRSRLEMGPKTEPYEVAGLTPHELDQTCKEQGTGDMEYTHPYLYPAYSYCTHSLILSSSTS